MKSEGTQLWQVFETDDKGNIAKNEYGDDASLLVPWFQFTKDGKTKSRSNEEEAAVIQTEWLDEHIKSLAKDARTNRYYTVMRRERMGGMDDYDGDKEPLPDLPVETPVYILTLLSEDRKRVGIVCSENKLIARPITVVPSLDNERVIDGI